MDYKIIVDSCGELTEELKQDVSFWMQPFRGETDPRLDGKR